MEEFLKFLGSLYETAGVPIRFAYIFWSMFVLVYLLITRYEKAHKLARKSRKLYRVNFPATLYLWGILSILIYHGGLSWGLTVFESQMAPDAPDYFVSGAFYLGLFGFVVIIIGLILVSVARIDLDGYWGVNIYIYPEGEHQLVRSGMYAVCRHPIYLGQILMAIGTWLLSNNYWIILFPLGTALFSVPRAFREEKYLAAVFGPDFESYKREVPFMIPGLA